MSRVVWNEHDGVNLLDWFVDRLPVREPWPADQCRAAGIVSDAGDLMGVVVFHHWSPTYRIVQVSAAAADPRWMRARDCWRQLWDYAFDHVGACKVWSETPAANSRALRFVQATGLTPRAVLPHHFGPALHAVYSDRTVWEHRGELAPRAIEAEEWPEFMAFVKAQQNVKDAYSAAHA